MLCYHNCVNKIIVKGVPFAANSLEVNTTNKILPYSYFFLVVLEVGWPVVSQPALHLFVNIAYELFHIESNLKNIFYSNVSYALYRVCLSWIQSDLHLCF